MATIVPRIRSTVSTVSRLRPRKSPTEQSLFPKDRPLQKYHSAGRLQLSSNNRHARACATVLPRDPPRGHGTAPPRSPSRALSSPDLSRCASDGAPAIGEEEVRALFQVWNSALSVGPDAVARCYSRDAVLLPTVSDVPRTTAALIRDYFVGFLEKRPRGEILDSNVMIGQGWCADFGIYEFTMGATGDVVRGRYSFVYVDEDGAWKIAHHHSSVMPEALLGPAPKPAV
eukprot:CAMPEP_0194274026 /NCGR_PEP_ID=MMETSP0169-20130528/7216_1 /TAXON_ID=218684 /ORGANISM="Corethron pennatum, Strain L29A3" /LENGTH=228 /DNA_ID=CAMNT_0039017121 /DNA_START=162 /DNA_END=848 /DNA_ORIENTATION=-